MTVSPQTAFEGLSHPEKTKLSGGLLAFATVLVVGLTGGIGSGKSTVAEMLAGKGAIVIDADRITHELQGPGQPVLAAMAERFGDQILNSDGTLDRGAVAEIVFCDRDALSDLNAIVHPAVGERIVEQMAAAEPDDIVVLDVPLLVESGSAQTAATIVVDADPEVAVARLVQNRGLSASDAKARMANQATREQRLERADLVIANDGDLDQLRRRVQDAWSWLQELHEELA